MLSPLTLGSNLISWKLGHFVIPEAIRYEAKDFMVLLSMKWEASGPLDTHGQKPMWLLSGEWGMETVGYLLRYVSYTIKKAGYVANFSFQDAICASECVA